MANWHARRSEASQPCRATPGIQRTVMLEQDHVAAPVFVRDGACWIGQVLTAGAVLPMPEIGVELPLDPLHAGLD